MTSVPARSLRVLLIDNYDSYVYNLFQRIGELTGTRCHVVRNDQTTLEECKAFAPTHVVISPGPGNPESPEYFGVCAAVIREMGAATPVLGVCLGHQGIGAVFGGKVVRAEKVMHGKTSTVEHDGTGVFVNLPSPLVAMRYHSLVVEPATVPACLRVTAKTRSGVIMGLSHRTLPIHGVQFHPESIGTPHGPALIKNFLEIGG